MQVVLKLARSVPKLIAQSNSIVASIGAHATIFATPNPSLATITSATEALAQAHTVALNKTKGAVAARLVKENALRNLLKALAAYVQILVNAAATPEEAAAIVEAAGMSGKAHTTYVKLPLTAEQGAKACSVDLEAKAGDGHGRCFYGWRWSVDGGKTYGAGTTTNHAHATVEDLPPLVTVLFQVQITTSDIAGAWSNPVPFLIQ
jgi:hypothetical protein